MRCKTYFLFFQYALVAVVLILANPVFPYQVILDGEDTAFRTKSASWSLDKTGSYLGNYKFSAAGPGAGNAHAVWDIDAIPSGIYDVEFYVDNGNYASTAQYIVEHDGGESTVIRSQNFVGTGWHTLGTFTFTGAGRITQTDAWTGGGTKVIADALRITLQGAPNLPSASDSVPPNITLMVDDLGALNPQNSSTFTYQLFNYPQDISYAIIPFLTYSNSVLIEAQAKGLQTILHQPMQLIGQPDSNPSDSTRLYISMNSTQILNTLNTNLNSVSPYVWGVNNHQGSRFSQYRTGLETVIQDFKDREIFFLDSRTISDSVSYDIAREKGLLTAERDLFVDGTSVANTKALIESVGMRALYAPNYNYVMICHQDANTVPGVFQGLDSAIASGVSVVKMEKNLHYIVETDKIPAGASVEINGAWTSTTKDMISHECFDGDALELPHIANGSVTFKPLMPKSGTYQIFVGSPGGANFSNMRVTVNHLLGSESKLVDQAVSRNRWSFVGTYSFAEGAGSSVMIQPPVVASGLGFVRADSVKFVYQSDQMFTAVEGWDLYR